LPIVSSVVVQDAAQRDGRRAVRERHTDQLGLTCDVFYLAEAAASAPAALAVHAGVIDAGLITAELDANERAALAQQSPTFNYCTLAQFRTRLRQRFSEFTGWDLVRLGKFINGLGLSDAQLQSLFGVSAGAQLTALKTKLANMAAHYDAVTADQGQ
jgi:hypothetical protein